ncbi:hypothetical protein UY3_01033 [Chelonia mydas]|uniref:Uncharacterized protein n=1 Tax=Chelonia mydas TaxID=8469 RepID=M7CKV2_CHEMY|nr:hypothetical protein UY3_01033 [Chelonia mydas]
MLTFAPEQLLLPHVFLIIPECEHDWLAEASICQAFQGRSCPSAMRYCFRLRNESSRAPSPEPGVNLLAT